MAPRLLLFVAGLWLAACSFGPKYTGAQGPGLALHGNRVSARGELVSVTASFEAGYLPALAGEYPVFRVAVRNTGSTPVTFTTANFNLLDDRGHQHAAILPGDIRDVHGRWYCRPRMGMDLGWGGWGWHGGGYGSLGPDGYYDPNYECDAPVEAMFNDSLLPAGPLLPGAKMVGFVFFRGSLGGSKTLTLVVSPPGEPPIRLPFRKR